MEYRKARLVFRTGSRFGGKAIGGSGVLAALIVIMMVMASGCQGTGGASKWRQDIIGTHTAVRAAAREDAWWKPRHQSVLEQIKAGPVNMIFIGDSITQGWERQGKEVWQKYYGGWQAVNMGFSGDRTQHVLWRLQNGEIEGIQPRLAVVMIGTNNSNGNDHTAEEIGQGVGVICQVLRERLPQTKILLLGIFPRGEKPGPQREKNAQASRLASTIADNKWIYYLDIGDRFLERDQTLSKDIMPDYLHLSPGGYQIWAEAMEPMVQKLMGK